MWWLIPLLLWCATSVPIALLIGRWLRNLETDEGGR